MTARRIQAAAQMDRRLYDVLAQESAARYDREAQLLVEEAAVLRATVARFLGRSQ